MTMLWDRMKEAVKDGPAEVLEERQTLNALLHGPSQGFDVKKATALLEAIEGMRRPS